MQLIDVIEVPLAGESRRIELLLGDLAAIPTEHRVDVLVVSAYPGDYTPTPSSLIGALLGRGLSVAELARAPAADLRQDFSCWMSKEVDSQTAMLGFRRILCFEPLVRGHPPEVVGDIFRSLAPFVYAEPEVRSVAMPIVAAGDQGHAISAMLPPLLDAAWHWLAIGFPLQTIKIVVRSQATAAQARPYFEDVRSRRSQPSGNSVPTGPVDQGADTAYDVFISYSRRDEEAARHLQSALAKKGVRVFIDKSEINAGASWQQKIFDALDDCSAIAVLYSRDFVQSKVCKEEFNIAWARQRELSREIIFPLLITDVALPTYMRILNYVDCRVSDRTKIYAAAETLAARFA